MKKKNNPFLVFGEQSVFDMIALIHNKKYFHTLNLGHIWKVPESTHDKNNFNLIPKYFFSRQIRAQADGFRFYFSHYLSRDSESQVKNGFPYNERHPRHDSENLVENSKRDYSRWQEEKKKIKDI